MVGGYGASLYNGRMRNIVRLTLLGPLLLGLPLAAAAADLRPKRPPENPAKITLNVAPRAVHPGGRAEVTLTLAPIDGIKIARYPQIKLEVPAQAGLVDQAKIALGSSTPPPLDELETNYWKQVDPLVLTLEVDEGASRGSHEVDAKLTYFFCVSGDYCAPARVPLKIPLNVE